VRLAVFYHLYQHDNWENFYREQFETLTSSGLLSSAEKVFIGINGNHQVTVEEEKIITTFNKHPELEESDTLCSLRYFCADNPDFKVLYFHTKGVTQPSPETADWRKTMEYFCIEKWEDCVKKLEDYDAVGCLYMDHCYYGFFPHFSGNFWWANASYINTLDHSYLMEGIRQNREFWIGTGNGKLYSFYTTGLNHYAHRSPRQLYASGD